MANADLPERLAQGSPLNVLTFDTIYSPDAMGYTDYPTLSGGAA